MSRDMACAMACSTLWLAPDDIVLTCYDTAATTSGFTTYRKFVKDFSRIASPLTSLLHKDAPYEWTTHRNDAFNQLKTAVSSAPILIIPNPQLQYTVTTDASGYAIGAALHQTHRHGSKPCAYL